MPCAAYRNYGSSPPRIGDAVLGTPGGVRIAEAGRHRQYDATMLVRHATELKGRELIHELLTGANTTKNARAQWPARW